MLWVVLKVPVNFDQKSMFSVVSFELWTMYTKQPNVIKILLFLFMLATDTESEHEKNIFNHNYHDFMNLLCVYWDRIMINRF